MLKDDEEKVIARNMILENIPPMLEQYKDDGVICNFIEAVREYLKGQIMAEAAMDVEAVVKKNADAEQAAAGH